MRKLGRQPFLQFIRENLQILKGEEPTKNDKSKRLKIMKTFVTDPCFIFNHRTILMDSGRRE